MSSGVVGALFFLAAFACFAGLFVVASFEYELMDHRLELRRRAFGVVPFDRIRLPLSIIGEVRRFELRRDWWPGALVFGNLFWRPAVLLVLKRGLWRRIYVTPRDPDEFVRKLMAALQFEDSPGES